VTALARLAAALALLVAAPAAAQAPGSIGSVERVVVWGYGTPPGARSRDLFERSPVVQDEVVETPRDGAVHLRFNDDTRFRVGSLSRATLDRFVFDPGRGGGELTIELSKGAFRFISGKIEKRNYVLTTPTATIGIRGTDFLVEVFESGETVVTVLEGLVTLRTRLLPIREIDLATGEAGRVPAGGGDPSRGTRGGFGNPVGDPGLRDDAGRGGGQDGGGGAGGTGGGGGGGGRN
jgi:hypothetical protein